MKSYLAHDKTSGAVYGGGRTACLQWAFKRIQNQQSAVINILVARHKAPARVIAEIDRHGGHWVFGGRVISGKRLSDLIRRVNHG